VTVRRRKPASPAVPEQFARFARSEWPPSLTCEEAVGYWHQARSAWAWEHQYEWQGYTTTPLGDRLDLLKARREARLLSCIEPDPAELNGHGY
jgi:hypothetical protein